MQLLRDSIHEFNFMKLMKSNINFYFVYGDSCIIEHLCVLYVSRKIEIRCGFRLLISQHFQLVMAIFSRRNKLHIVDFMS